MTIRRSGGAVWCQALVATSAAVERHRTPVPKWKADDCFSKSGENLQGYPTFTGMTHCQVTNVLKMRRKFRTMRSRAMAAPASLASHPLTYSPIMWLCGALALISLTQWHSLVEQKQNKYKHRATKQLPRPQWSLWKSRQEIIEAYEDFQKQVLGLFRLSVSYVYWN